MRAARQHGIRNVRIGAKPVSAPVSDTFPTPPLLTNKSARERRQNVILTPQQ